LDPDERCRKKYFEKKKNEESASVVSYFSASETFIAFFKLLEKVSNYNSSSLLASLKPLFQRLNYHFPKTSRR